jgi:hypothetical protein
MVSRGLHFLFFSTLFGLAACSGGGATRTAFGAGPADENGASDDDTQTSTDPTEPAATGKGKNSCTPDCSDKECGDDGCGGECGTCSGKAKCSSNNTCETPVPAGVTCPPTKPTGTKVGNVVKVGSLPLAKGGSYDLRANCAKPIYILGVTETCGICMQKLGVWAKANNFLDQLKADGVDVVLVSTDNSSGTPGSVSTANALKNRFGLGDRFFLGYEPAGSAIGSPDTHSDGFIPLHTQMSGARIALIIKPGNIIGAVGQVDDTLDIRDALGL